MAIEAFKEAKVTTDSGEFESWAARRLRYEMNWAAYENTAYREVHSWAKYMKNRYGLYDYIRSIYSPAFKLGNFYQTHIWGGDLPQIDGSPEIVRAVEELWKWSNWQVRKDIVTLWGAVLGDVALRVVDDIEKQRVYIEVLHPGLIESVEKDSFGNVKGYVIEDTVSRPNGSGTVTYTEEVARDGMDVVYRTFLNGQPYAWNGVSAEWREPYGFVPMALIQHNDVGLEWGWSELHPARSKMQELDDLASMVSDQIRKTINPIWLFKGMQSGNITFERQDPTNARPEPGREQIPAIYAGEGASAQALVAPLQMGDALGHINSILEDMERDYPELRPLPIQELSGRALRILRQPVENKVLQRRQNYDEALVKANQMAVAIGGFRGYEEYRGFNLDSYDAGQLDHSIADRPVFKLDEQDELEIQKLRLEVAKLERELGGNGGNDGV